MYSASTMDSDTDRQPRTYIIKRSQHLGYGFMAGYELPTMVKAVEPNGPSNKRLLPGDIIMSVNGIEVENAPREQIIKMIQRCIDQIEIKVRQPTYEELIQARNLADTKFYVAKQPLAPYHHYAHQPPPLPSTNPPLSPLNRLVTSIAQQQHSPNPPIGPFKEDTPPVQIKNGSKQVLRQQSTNRFDLDSNNNNCQTLGRGHTSYGRHSPLPQRCKSSIDGGQNGKFNKDSGYGENDQPLLKRSNTMRPIRPPAKVMEIFEVVIKIFFEDGHTRVLNYNQDTTVGTILEALSARLIGNSSHSEQVKRYFGLTLTVGVNAEGGIKEPLNKRKLLHVLDENDSIMKIRQLPYAPRLRLLYRMVNPPSDINDLYCKDKVAFDYLYQQSCNDLKLERFNPNIDQETALKLSALHLLEYVHSNYSKAHGNSKDPKVYMKLVKKNPGIEYFLPVSLAEAMLDKKGKRIITQYKKTRTRLTEQLKSNFEEFDFEPPSVKSTTNLNRYSSTSFHELSLPEMRSSPSDYIKLLFLNYLSQLPCYGNSKRPVRTSTSPIERNGDCSSSLESVPRTSDSSPLIRQDRSQVSCDGPKNIPRLAQMNSIRSLNSTRSSSICQPVERSDMAPTPSIESISSITFNLQNSPSPQQSQYNNSRINENHSLLSTTTVTTEPSPMPRQLKSRVQEYNSIERLYNQRYTFNDRPIEELLRNVVLMPPPPLNVTAYEINNQVLSGPSSYLTQILTDNDIEKLIAPPPPRRATQILR